jgi:hypothetical protein
MVTISVSIMVTASCTHASSSVTVSVKLSFIAPDPWPPLDGDSLLELLGHMTQGTLQAVSAVSKELKRVAYDPAVPGRPWSSIDMAKWPFFLKEKKHVDATAAADAMPDGIDQWIATTFLHGIGTAWSTSTVSTSEPTDRDVIAAVRQAGVLLKTLTCNPTLLTDNLFVQIGASATNLTALDLSTPKGMFSSTETDLTDAAMASIGATLLCLTRLTLSHHMTKVTDDGVMLLLQNLGAGLKQLRVPLPMCTELTLRYVGQYCSQLTDLDIDNLGSRIGRRTGNDVSALGPAAEPELHRIFEANGNTLEHINLGYGCVVDVLNSTMIQMMTSLPRHKLRSFRGVRLSLCGGGFPSPRGRLELILPQDSPVLGYAKEKNIDVVLMDDLTEQVWELFTWYFNAATSLSIDDVGAEHIGVLNDFDLERG